MPVSGSQSAGRTRVRWFGPDYGDKFLHANQARNGHRARVAHCVKRIRGHNEGSGCRRQCVRITWCSRAAHATYWRHNPLPIRAVHSLRGGHTFVVDLDGDPRHDIIMHHRVCRRGKPSRRYGASPTSQHRVVSQSVSSPMIGVRSPCMTRAEVPGLNGLRACADATYWVRRRRKVDAKPENRRPTDPSCRSRWAHSITEVAGIGVGKRHRG